MNKVINRHFSKIKQNAPLLLILIVALALRLPFLQGSFWLDEAAQALESTRPLSQQLAITDDFQPPLLHLIIHAAQYLGTAEWWLRTVGALIPGLLSVLGVYLIGEILFSKRVGYAAALLLATSSFHVFYSQELRPYALPAVFGIYSWYLLLASWRQNYLNGSRQAWFVLVSVLGLYSSYLYPFLLLAQVIFIFSYLRPTWRLWFRSLVMITFGFLPWIPSFLAQLRAGTALAESLPGWSSVVSIPQTRSIPLVVAKFIFGVTDVELSITHISLTVFLVAVILFTLYYALRYHEGKNRFIAMLMWLILPILSAWLVSFLVPVLQPKRVLYALPALYLLVAALEESVSKKTFFHWLKPKNPIQPWMSAVTSSLVAVLLLINILGVSQYYQDTRLQRENWRELVSQIQQQYPEKAAVLMSFDAPFAPWRWYANPSYPVFTTGTLQVADQASLVTRLKTITEYDHVLLFDYLRDLTDPERKLDAFLKVYGYKQTGAIDYPGIGYVRIYSKPTAVISYQLE